MIRIEITSTDVNERRFEKDGKELVFREQEAWLYSGGVYPVRFVLSLGRDDAFAPGFYRLGAGSFGISRFGGLELLRRLELLPEA